jgi:hypothetical protein
VSDRVSERRRAAALARHYREQEDLTIAEIARRLGRAEATVKAYLYDPSYANKRPTDSPQVCDSSGRLLVMHGRRSASGSSALAATAQGRRSPTTRFVRKRQRRGLGGRRSAAGSWMQNRALAGLQ